MSLPKLWPALRIASDIRELWNQLSELQERVQAGRFRGHADAEWRLCSSFDRAFIHVVKSGDRLRCAELESQLVCDFLTRARGYIGWTERPFLDGVGPYQYALARHYGLASRLIDWTRSAFVAAYFAVADYQHRERDGAVVWYDGIALHRAMPSQWQKVFGQPSDVNAKVLSAAAGSSTPRPFLTEQHIPFPFPRIAVQQGHFTLHSHFDADHGDAIAKLIPQDGATGRLIIPKALKGPLLKQLQGLNFCAEAVHTAEPHLIAHRLNIGDAL